MAHSVLDDIDKRALLLQLVANGLPPQSAAAIVGVAGRTYREWSTKAREDPGSVYGVMMDQIAEAEAQVEKVAVYAIHKAMTGWTESKTEQTVDPTNGNVTKVTVTEKFDWRAAAEFLERRFPSRWAPRPPDDEERRQHVRRFTIEGDNPFLFVGAVPLLETPHEVLRLEQEASPERAEALGREGAGSSDAEEDQGSPGGE